MNKPNKFQTKIFINNQYVESSSGKKIPVINPATEEEICQIEEGCEKEIDMAVQAARQAFKEWKFFPKHKRSALIYKLAQLIRKNIDELAALESLDNGKPLSLASFDIDQVAESLEFFAGASDKYSGKCYPPEKDYNTQYRKEPYPVVGLISPWNYPLLMADWKFAPALAAGCCIILKPSEVTPLTCLKLGEYIVEAGFPPGVFNIVPGYGHIIGEYLCRHPQVYKISFTGSNLVGRKILKASAESNLKKVHLELGGKSPVVVFDDCDLQDTIPKVWEAIMCNMGQVCDAGSRLFVQKSIYDKVVQGLIKMNDTVKIGDAFSGEDINFGPLVNQRQFETVLEYIRYGIEEEKAKCLLGGKRYGEKGYFVQPTLLADIADNSKLAQEEIFGPVLCIMKPFETIDEVIERANNSKYGLAAYVFTKDFQKQEKMINHLEVGSVYVNMLAGALASVPFGGYKESGFGRDNGLEAVEEFLQVKAVYQYIQQ